MRYIDLTHPFTNSMPTYPGDPNVELQQTAHLDKDGYNDFQLKTGMHVGTHIDAPLHVIGGGKKISEYELDYFFGKGHLIDARKQKKIGADLLQNNNIETGDIVIVHTDFYKKFGDKEYFKNYPEISTDFAEEIINLGVKILGIDTPSPDRPPFNIHKILLENNVLIIENLSNLEPLLSLDNFDIMAIPMKIEAEAAPARVVAILNK